MPSNIVNTVERLSAHDARVRTRIPVERKDEETDFPGLRALGVVIVRRVNDVLVDVELPTGWRISLAPNDPTGRTSNLLDSANNVRGFTWLKGVGYDYRGHTVLRRRLETRADYRLEQQRSPLPPVAVIDQKSAFPNISVVHWATPTQEDIEAYGRARAACRLPGRTTVDYEALVEAENAVRNHAFAWITEHYPDRGYEAYWDLEIPVIETYTEA